MTIREIAQLAGVSISTVSKIVNGKDQGIHPDTRERVLQLVKQYNYSPYAGIKSRTSSRSFLLGLLVRDLDALPELAEGMVRRAGLRGYRVVVCESRSGAELESVLQLCKHGVDSVLWEPVDLSLEAHFQKAGIPVSLLESREPEAPDGLFRAGFFATAKLLEMGHTSLACAMPDSGLASSRFLLGYRSALREHGLPFRPELARQGGHACGRLLSEEITGVACLSASLASYLLKTGGELRLQAPGDFSLVMACATRGEMGDPPFATAVLIPHRELGERLCDQAVDLAEGRKPSPLAPLELSLTPGGTLEAPRRNRSNRILVVGNINMDIIVNVEELPQLGKTVLAHQSVALPGGKGANQAVGASRLGADVALLSRVGTDREAREVLQVLGANHVDTRQILRDGAAPTGKAYIHVRGDSESSIAICPGANNLLTPADILERRELFAQASVCLLQTEIPLETVRAAAGLAREQGVRTILKPSLIPAVDRKLLELVDVLVPNSTECAILSPPDRESLEDQAQFFLELGAGSVIVTLGARGCYLHSPGRSLYLPALRVEAVDATGSSDAFISALGARLLKGVDLVEAARFAIAAAGLSVTRRGAMTALADESTVLMYLDREDRGVSPHTPPAF